MENGGTWGIIDFLSRCLKMIRSEEEVLDFVSYYENYKSVKEVLDRSQ